MVEPNQPLALLIGLVLIADASESMVLAMASNAAWLMAIRTMSGI
jgi:hypothetical protein